MNCFERDLGGVYFITRLGVGCSLLILMFNYFNVEHRERNPICLGVNQHLQVLAALNNTSLSDNFYDEYQIAKGPLRPCCMLSMKRLL